MQPDTTAVEVHPAPPAMAATLPAIMLTVNAPTSISLSDFMVRVGTTRKLHFSILLKLSYRG